MTITGMVSTVPGMGFRSIGDVDASNSRGVSAHPALIAANDATLLRNNCLRE